MKLKIPIYFVSIALIFSSLINMSYAASDGMNWYIKRSGHSCPAIEKTQEIIEDYGGFYIDKKSCELDRKIIYLTFDAGYENGNVEKILDTLLQKKVVAAFFLLDNIIIKNKELVTRMVDEGHLVCNHTKNHKDLTKCSDVEIETNIRSLEKIYEDNIGRKLSQFFRFPEGKYSISAMKKVADMGYKTVFWSFAYADWDNGKQPTEEYARKLIIENTHPGEIILLHPTSSTNAKILPMLIDEWRSMGYDFGSLEDVELGF